MLRAYMRPLTKTLQSQGSTNISA